MEKPSAMFTSWRELIFGKRPALRSRRLRHRASLALETLEDRTVPAVSSNLVGHALIVTADTAPDAILLQGDAAGQTIQVIDQQAGTVVGSYHSGDFSSLVITGGSITLSGSVASGTMTLLASGNIIAASGSSVEAGAVTLEAHNIGLAG